MSTVQLIPKGYDVRVFDAHMESANGIPNVTSFFRTMYDGLQSWYRDNYEGKINATVQIFGTPFSLASNMFNLIVRIYQIGAVLGLQNATTSSFFKPMAITGLAVAVLESFYHIYGLTFQLNFAYNFYKRDDPKEYFSYLFHNFLGINKKDEAVIRKKILRKDVSFSGEIRASYIVKTSLSTQIRMAKMLPFARRVQPWLVHDITQTLSENPEGVSQEQVDEWMELIEIQMLKKIVLHTLALATIVTLGAGLTLALMGAAPLVSVALLSISPFLTAAQYLFENGYLVTAGWNFEWRNCVPAWVRSALSALDPAIEEKLAFTPGQRLHPVDPRPRVIEMQALA